MPRSKLKRFVAAARVFAGWLVAVLLVFEVLAANGEFHQSLHQGGKAASSNCFLCLLAKGQVDSPPSVSVVTARVWSIFQTAPQMESVALLDFTFLASSSRAPPALAHALSTAA
jgi:hypothetical protein